MKQIPNLPRHEKNRVAPVLRGGRGLKPRNIQRLARFLVQLRPSYGAGED